MQDLRERIMRIIGRPQLMEFATITEDGKPWVRYVLSFGSKDMTIRFSSFASARKVKQIAANPEVHITCGVIDPTKMAPYLQIQGMARYTTEKEERYALWNDMLKPIFSNPDNPNYGIVIVAPYRIEYCTPGVFVPEVWERPEGK